MKKKIAAYLNEEEAKMFDEIAIKRARITTVGAKFHGVYSEIINEAIKLLYKKEKRCKKALKHKQR